MLGEQITVLISDLYTHNSDAQCAKVGIMGLNFFSISIANSINTYRTSTIVTRGSYTLNSLDVGSLVSKKIVLISDLYTHYSDAQCAKVSIIGPKSSREIESINKAFLC